MLLDGIWNLAVTIQDCEPNKSLLSLVTPAVDEMALDNTPGMGSKCSPPLLTSVFQMPLNLPIK